MRNKLFLTAAILLSLSLLPAGCGSGGKKEKLEIRFAFFPNITHSQALAAKAEGQFQKAVGGSAEIQWKMFNAGPAEIEALLAGEIDIGYIGPVPAINGYAKSNGELRIIAGAASAGAILVSRRDLDITGLSQLSGKKIAVPQFGNTQDLCLRALLKENSLKDASSGGTVEILQVNNPDIKLLLDRGKLDAALVPEPWGSQLAGEIGAKVVLDYDRIFNNGNYPSAVMIVRTQFLKEHGSLVERLVKAHVEITQELNHRKDHGKSVIGKQIRTLTNSGIDGDILDSSLKRLKITYDPEKASVLEFSKLLQELGMLKQAPDMGNLLDLNLLGKVLREKGLDEVG